MLSPLKSNRFLESVLNDSKESLQWFDLNFFGKAFELKDPSVWNLDKMLVQYKLSDFIKLIDSENSI